MDLTRDFPRSPYDMLTGLVMLPRTADKARAHRSGRLGDYSYNCLLDEELFAFLGIDAELFAEQVDRNSTDEELAAWIEEACPRTALEKGAFNDRMRHLTPAGEEGRGWLEERRRELGREDLHSYFEVLDADEGRF